jgi:flagellar FliL protein
VFGGRVADAAKKDEKEEKGGKGEKAEGAAEAPPKDRKGLILTILLVFNTLVILGVGIGLFMYVQTTKEALKHDEKILTENHEETKEKTKSAEEAKLVALEPFIVNLSGSEGYKLLKVAMSLEVENAPTQEEITKRQAQVKDIVLVLLSSKTYSEVSGDQAQQKLKDEIMDTVNSFLTKGKIKKILFTEFIFT